MCLCRRFNTYRSRYLWTMVTEILILIFLALYWVKVAFFANWIEDLPWNYHAYFGMQVAMLTVIIVVRRFEMKYLSVNEREPGMEEQIYWRTLKFDAYRSFAFTVDMAVGFTVFRQYEFFDYTQEVESIWNWGFFSYILYACFIGGFYVLFVACDVVAEIRKWRKRVITQR